MALYAAGQKLPVQILKSRAVMPDRGRVPSRISPTSRTLRRSCVSVSWLRSAELTDTLLRRSVGEILEGTRPRSGITGPAFVILRLIARLKSLSGEATCIYLAVCFICIIAHLLGGVVVEAYRTRHIKLSSWYADNVGTAVAWISS